MTSSISLIARYLEPFQQKELALKLAGDLHHQDNVVILCELLDSLDGAIKTEIYPKVLEFSLAQLVRTQHDVEEMDYSGVLSLMSKLPQLTRDLLEYVKLYTIAFIQASSVKFLPKVKDLLADNEITQEIEKSQFTIEEKNLDDMDFFVSLFKFMEKLFMTYPTITDSSIDSLSLVALCVNDEDLSHAASKIFRWRLSSILQSKRDASFLWKIIFILEDSDVGYHVNEAYILWLRSLNEAGQSLHSDQDYQTLVQSDHYWAVLQNGLISDLHEQRKFCLSILQLSVKGVNTDIATTVMTWDSEKSEQYLVDWRRYVTLFEILGIDTSLHQAEAATKDILNLITPTSLIPSSWGFCLLSTGFKATVDSVRRFTLNLFLSIPPPNLYLIKDSCQFLEKIYLPNAMLASHFIVRQKEGVNQNYCEYGEKLCQFIENIIKSLSAESLAIVVETIFNVLDNLKDSFDPARIYVSLGVLRGMKGKEYLGPRHIEYLIRIFEVTAEGQLFETTIQTINLKFLLHLDFKHVKLSGFINVLTKFVQFNGYKLLVDNIDLVVDYLVKNSTPEEITSYMTQHFRSSEIDSIIIAIGLLLSMKVSLDVALIFGYSEKFQLLCDLLISGFDMNDLLNETHFRDVYQELLAKLIMENDEVVSEANLYEKCSSDSVLSNPLIVDDEFINEIDVTQLWESINSSIVSTDETELRIVTKKLQFFNALLKKCIYSQPSYETLFTVESLVNFDSQLFVNAPKNASKDFYKVRDEITGHYYNLVQISLSLYQLDTSCCDRFFDIIEKNLSLTSYYSSSLAMIQLIQHMLQQITVSEEQLERIVLINMTLWDELLDERLAMNQRNLHLLIIDCLYGSTILAASATSTIIRDSLMIFGKSIIEHSSGRRSLLPRLTKNISTFQLQAKSSFNNCFWLAEILIRSFILVQLKNNIFKLENIIGDLYDKRISFFGNIYEDVYGPEELSAKINIYAILGSKYSEDFAWTIFQFILDNEAEFSLFLVTRMTDGFEETRRLELYSIIMLVFTNINSSRLLDGGYISNFIGYMNQDPSPLVRNYLEWIIALYLLESTEFTSEIFQVLLDLCEAANKPTLIASYERTIYLMIQQLSFDKQEPLITRLLSLIIPASASNKPITRHFSLSLICAIYPKVTAKNIPLDKSLLAIVKNMYTSALKSDSFGQYRSGDALMWDIKKDLTLVTIAGGLLLKLNDRDIDYITSSTFNKYLSDEQKENLHVPIGLDSKELTYKQRRFQHQRRKEEVSMTESPLQTKSGAWSTVMDIDSSRNADIQRSDLIVVSSLVDKPPNLGGICRLCDVLGAGLLTVNDIKVKAHPQFKNVAVTADQWMPILEVKPEEILDFFKQKKKEGYTLIGLEQTDKSVELNSELKFPKKSLILLGREKEGVPGDLLAELDFCVEIKQVGVIRSMNIQTATAVIVHAYSSQHC